MPARKTAAVPWILVLALAATTAWLWRAFENERQRSKPPQLQVSQLPLERPHSGNSRPEDPATQCAVSASQAQQDQPEATLLLRGPQAFEDDPRLLQDPHYRQARLRFYEAIFAEQYPDLARVLNIPEETADRLIELRAEQQLRQFSTLPLEAPPLDEASRRSFELEQQQRQYEADAEIAALIGSAKLRQWQEYDATLGERQQVRMLRLELMDSPVPLGSDKAELLVRALYEERLRIEQDAQAMLPDAQSRTVENLAEMEAESSRRMLKAADKVLSPDQLRTFRKMLERQQDLQSAIQEKHLAKIQAIGPLGETE